MTEYIDKSKTFKIKIIFSQFFIHIKTLPFITRGNSPDILTMLYFCKVFPLYLIEYLLYSTPHAFSTFIKVENKTYSFDWTLHKLSNFENCKYAKCQWKWTKVI